MATFHTGVCESCAKNLVTVADNPDLQGLCTFSAANNWDPLNDLDNVDFPFGRLIGIDRSALIKELRYLQEHATVTEAMFTALEHMQVTACYLQGSHAGKRSMTGFKKNIISFPQDLTELKQWRNFLTNLEAHDVVNVILPTDTTNSLTRARVSTWNEETVTVELADKSSVTVPLERIRQRVKLPWKPRDIADHLMVFRRCRGSSNEFVESLEVRREMIKRILLLLSTEGQWR